jgi:hypothetical protein
MHTCSKLGIAFFDYLGDRLGIQAQPGLACAHSLARAEADPRLTGPESRRKVGVRVRHYELT